MIHKMRTTTLRKRFRPIPQDSDTNFANFSTEFSQKPTGISPKNIRIFWGLCNTGRPYFAGFVSHPNNEIGVRIGLYVGKIA